MNSSLEVSREQFFLLRPPPSEIKHYHCVKGVRIWSYCGLYFPAFGLHTETYLSVFSPNAGKYGPE